MAVGLAAAVGMGVADEILKQVVMLGPKVGCKAACNPHCRGPQPLQGSGLDLTVAQELTNHRQAFNEGESPRRLGAADLVAWVALVLPSGDRWVAITDGTEHRACEMGSLIRGISKKKILFRPQNRVSNLRVVLRIQHYNF